MSFKEKRKEQALKAVTRSNEVRAEKRANGTAKVRVVSRIEDRPHRMLPDGDRMITVNEAAALLLVVRQTIYLRVRLVQMQEPQELGPMRVGYSLRYIQSLIGKSTGVVAATAKKTAAKLKKAA